MLLSNKCTSLLFPSYSLAKQPFTWRIDLRMTAPYWKEWFEGLSKIFLSTPVPKLLILAGQCDVNDRVQLCFTWNYSLVNICGISLIVFLHMKITVVNGIMQVTAFTGPYARGENEPTHLMVSFACIECYFVCEEDQSLFFILCTVQCGHCVFMLAVASHLVYCQLLFANGFQLQSRHLALGIFVHRSTWINKYIMRKLHLLP